MMHLCISLFVITLDGACYSLYFKSDFADSSYWILLDFISFVNCFQLFKSEVMLHHLDFQTFNKNSISLFWTWNSHLFMEFINFILEIVKHRIWAKLVKSYYQYFLDLNYLSLSKVSYYFFLYYHKLYLSKPKDYNHSSMYWFKLVSWFKTMRSLIYYQLTKQLTIDLQYCNVNWYHCRLLFAVVHSRLEVLIIKMILSAYSFTEVLPYLFLGWLMRHCCFETVRLNWVLNSADWPKHKFIFGSVILVIKDRRSINLPDELLILFLQLIYSLMVFKCDGFHFYSFS